jgi:predicted enzyme related to lactoylglutathione lyase
MSRVVHFEILSDDPEKTAAFYRDALGWESNLWPAEEYWLVTTRPDGTPGINGGLMKRQLDQSVINTSEVDSLEETTRKIEAAGGKLVHGPNEVPNIGTHAYFEDPDGTLFGVMQPAAK